MTEKLPSEVAGAICEVMAGIGTLGKEDKNDHGGYKFASIDAFLSAVNPLCAKAGLFILQNEEHCEVVPPSGNSKQGTLAITFSHTICHKSGEMLPPVTRTVMVQALGAQAFGSAQSYALKQFLRATFLVATGDADDPDFKEAKNLPTKSSAQAKRDGDYEAIKAELDSATTMPALAAAWRATAARREKLSDNWKDAISDYKDACKAALQKGAPDGPDAPLNVDEWFTEYEAQLAACDNFDDLAAISDEAAPIVAQYPTHIQERASLAVIVASKRITKAKETK